MAAMLDIEAPLNCEDKIRIITEVYKPLIIEILDVKDIAEHLKIQFGKDDAMFNTVLEMIQNGETRSNVAKCFLEALTHKKDKRGLYQAVIDALCESEYGVLAAHLEGTCNFDTKRRDWYRSFLMLYASRLEDIAPLQLLASMGKYLTKRDVEKIRKTVRNEGDCTGASELLLRLDRKSEPCFEDFIKALAENGSGRLAEEMKEMKNFALGIGTEDMEVDDGINGEDIPVVGNVSDNEVEELILRNYQEEVLTPALKGQNVVVVLPTNKGKTEVAIALMRRRFLARGYPTGATSQRRPKSVFVVNKVPLVKQQKDRCLKYLRGSCDIAGTSGEELNQVPLDIVLTNNDITVLTAQVLVNALKDDNIDLTLSHISLLVLDECHHCQKSDPYNILMAMYRDLKLNSPKLPRPQILGLTASPGVGNSKNKVQAREYITKLCANLDCRISRPKIYTRHVEDEKDSTEEIQRIVKGRSLEDPYFRAISEIMGDIENRIRNVEAGRAIVDETNEFTKMETRHGTQGYEQGVVNLKMKIQQRVVNEEDRRELIACVDYLREYNDSLFVNRDAQTSDAISYMENYINEQERTSPSGPADILLKKMFRDKLGDLNRIAKLGISKNPVLGELERILKLEYGKKNDSLSIIFIKTRESARAFVKWINEDPFLGQFKADILIGSGGSDGMTSSEHGQNLQLFKDKAYKILVATSVGEEGLDISQCNLAFRYNYVTSDIGHEQTKGRIRAFKGKMYVIINSDLQLQDRELKNIIRVKMTNEAVKQLADDILSDPKSFDDLILKEQKRDQRERQMEQASALSLKANKVEKTGIVLRCTKCFKEACSLDDVRSIESQHHVVIDDLFLDKMKLIDLAKQPVIAGMKYHQKIHCANCQYKWGTMVVYRQQELPLIAVRNFTLVDTSNGRKFCVKAWKDVPFAVRPIDLGDLGKQNNVAAGVNGEGNEEGDHSEDDELIEYSNIMQPDD